MSSELAISARASARVRFKTTFLTCVSSHCATGLSSTASPMPMFSLTTIFRVAWMGVSRSAACRYLDGNDFFQWAMTSPCLWQSEAARRIATDAPMLAPDLRFRQVGRRRESGRLGVVSFRRDKPRGKPPLDAVGGIQDPTCDTNERRPDPQAAPPLERPRRQCLGIRPNRLQPVGEIDHVCTWGLAGMCEECEDPS